MMQMSWSRAEAVRWAGPAPDAEGLTLLFLSAGTGALAERAARFAAARAPGRLRVGAGSFEAPGAGLADAELVVVIRTLADRQPPLLHEGGRVEWMVGEGDIELLLGHVRGLLGDLGTAGLLLPQRMSCRPARPGARP